MTTNAITNTRIPRNVYTRALITFATGLRFILFASSIVVVAAVNRTIGPGVVSHRLRHILHLIHGIHTPAAILRESDHAQDQHSVNQINFSKHYSSLSVLTIGDGGWSLSDQRDRSKLTDRQVIKTAGN